MVATAERAILAQRLLADSVEKQGIEPDSLTIHADRGSSMTSRPVALLLADLGIVKSHSRPYTSDDNPYSEAGFKTLGVPARLSRPVRLDRGCPGLLPGLLRLVQRRAPPQRDRAVHPGRRPLRPDGPATRSSSRRLRRRLRRPPRALRQGTAGAEARAGRGLDQPARAGGAASLIFERWCLTGLDRFRRVQTAIPPRIRCHPCTFMRDPFPGGTDICPALGERSSVLTPGSSRAARFVTRGRVRHARPGSSRVAGFVTRGRVRQARPSPPTPRQPSARGIPSGQVGQSRMPPVHSRASLQPEEIPCAHPIPWHSLSSRSSPRPARVSALPLHRLRPAGRRPQRPARHA